MKPNPQELHQKDLQERSKKFLEEYKELVKKYRLDFFPQIQLGELPPQKDGDNKPGS